MTVTTAIETTATISAVPTKPTTLSEDTTNAGFLEGGSVTNLAFSQLPDENANIWQGIDDYNRFTYTEPTAQTKGFFTMVVRVNVGSQTLGPVQVEVSYDVLQYEVISISESTSWGDGEFMWTVDVPFGTMFVGGLHAAQKPGLAEIAVVTLRARDFSTAMDASSFTSRMVSALDANGSALDAVRQGRAPVERCAEFPIGDVNQDCVFDMADPWWLQAYHEALSATSVNSPCTTAFDANVDGVCTRADVTFMLRVLFRQTQYIYNVQSTPSPLASCTTRLSLQLQPLATQTTIGIEPPQVYLVLGGATDAASGWSVPTPKLDVVSGVDSGSLSIGPYKGVVVAAKNNGDQFFVDIRAGWNIKLGVSVIVNSPLIRTQDRSSAPYFFSSATSATASKFDYMDDFAVNLPASSSSTSGVVGFTVQDGFNYLTHLQVAAGCTNQAVASTAVPSTNEPIRVDESAVPSFDVDETTVTNTDDSSRMLIAVVATLIVVIIALIITTIAMYIRRSRRRLGLTVGRGTGNGVHFPLHPSVVRKNNRQLPRKPKRRDNFDEMIRPDLIHRPEWAEVAQMTRKKVQKNAPNGTDLDALLPDGGDMSSRELHEKTFQLAHLPVVTPAKLSATIQPVAQVAPAMVVVAPHRRVAPPYVPPKPYQEVVGGLQLNVTAAATQNVRTMLDTTTAKPPPPAPVPSETPPAHNFPMVTVTSTPATETPSNQSVGPAGFALAWSQQAGHQRIDTPQSMRQQARILSVYDGRPISQFDEPAFMSSGHNWN
jgi:hypothetical protein